MKKSPASDSNSRTDESSATSEVDDQSKDNNSESQLLESAPIGRDQEAKSARDDHHRTGAGETSESRSSLTASPDDQKT